MVGQGVLIGGMGVGVRWWAVRSLHTHARNAQLAVARAESATTSLRPITEMPGPKCYPVIGCAPELFFGKGDTKLDNTQSHKAFIALRNKYGDVYHLKLPGFPPMVVTHKPEHAELMIRATMKNPIRQPMGSLRKIRMDAVEDFQKKCGIFTENGDEWWRVRSRVQTPMMKPFNISAYLQSMDQVACDFMDRIADFQSLYGEMPDDFQFEMYKWAIESVGLVALNRRLGCLDPNIAADSDQMKIINTVQDLFKYLNDVELSFPLWRVYPTKNFRKLRNTHENFLSLAVDNIRQTEEALKARDPNGEHEVNLMETLLLTPGLSRKDVITLILDMLFAGIDTTAHTLAFTLYCLARNPEVQSKLQAEVDAVLGQHQGPLQPKHLAQMSYLKAVVRENLRMFPIVMGTGRDMIEDTEIDGYNVPKGYIVMGLSLITGWDERYFPRAQEFIPERWLRHRPLGPIHPYASLPFGAGTRMCVGRRIAEQEIYTFLVRVMQRFSVEYHYEDFEIRTQLVSRPSQPAKFKFTERN